MNNRRAPENRFPVLAVLELLTAVGLVLFWLGFFTIGLAPENPPPGYFVYEHSFPLPDLALAVVLAVSSLLLLKGRPGGRPLALLASGALFFLGLVDISFNLQNGVYLLSTLDLILNAFINLWCLGLGLALYLAFRRPNAG
ncbi:MAG: hypothetical protein AB1641_15980 [Thermodesulfobacteriota bacterium]